ncbi:two component, sigma54 specific, Fis family transcriptional regulator [Caballeronia pedi]|uniref:Two component, sigma54 specific, Fis family transcriptional regulator n=1 Tax=Caballeronia pedi TaxID=1777141 RepID=A0A158C0V1_9BURK|nr:sigma-54 dependent transcriptional regulator [Caballeronia pedi]SAK75952.1 two component, sigma54 specific, Fis family transcriptional regulator [Caballeronia pedi]
MDALAVARIGQDMVSAAQLNELCGAFMQGVVQSGGVQLAFCYAQDVTGERLLPLTDVKAATATSLATSTQEWPVIEMGELDNPLVYSLLGSEPCQVDHVDQLVSVGQGFDLLREHFPARCALLAMPLCSTRAHTLAVLVFVGSAVTLRAWRTDPVWQTLAGMHEQLFARLSEQMDEAQRLRYERTVAHRLEAEQGRSRAQRLLAAEFIGKSAQARSIREDMLRLADSSLSTLITGETGTGKDHAAWLIHQASSRSGAFVPVNCAAISAELIEAELFGSVKGAFTGATQSRSGLVAEANGGTLFLDEIGDMPLPLQATLLRVLNEKRYRPVGSTRECESDFRLICATHQPLPRLIRENRFREDLYFRIRQMTLHMPSLRERAEDIPALAMHVLLHFNRERRAHLSGIDEQALAWLCGQTFPGNVRELRSLVMAAAEYVGPGARIGVEALRRLKVSLDVPTVPEQCAQREAAPGPVDQSVRELLSMPSLPQAVDAFEQMLIRQRLRQSDGSRSRAAVSLGIPKRTLARKCQKWNLDQESHVS